MQLRLLVSIGLLGYQRVPLESSDKHHLSCRFCRVRGQGLRPLVRPARVVYSPLGSKEFTSQGSGDKILILSFVVNQEYNY